MQYIVTHTSPDWDAIGACWLLCRYGADLLASPVEIGFVNTGNPDLAGLASASAVVDTGRVHDPNLLRFDHHHDAALPSATMLVYEYLMQCRLAPLSLEPLIQLIDDGDTGQKGAHESQKRGIHAMLSAYKRSSNVSDSDIITWGFAQLDLLDAELQHRAAARARLEPCLTYQSRDGLVVGLMGGDANVTQAAHEWLGARLAVFANTETLPDGSVTHTVGVTRLGGAEITTPDVGALVATLIEETRLPAMQTELRRWFRHPAGFFAGRGTRKAPDATPLDIRVETIAYALDMTWTRPTNSRDRAF